MAHQSGEDEAAAVVIFAFGNHELDDDRFELRHAGRPVAVQPKVLELLLYLVRNRGRVVSKSELLEAVWPDAIVTESSLARAVSLGRLAIGDRSPEPELLVTIPRHGYHFRAPVTESATAPASSDPASCYVGRADLLARLESTLDAALSGSGRILFLAGEAGIGKTRTAELLAERALRSGADVATSWGLDEEPSPPCWSWTRALRGLARRAGPDLEALVAEDGPELARLVPELSGDASALAVPERDGEGARFRLFEAVASFLARAAARRPVALFLDDLHFADAESLWLLEHVGRTIGSRRLAIVVTCREEDASHAPLRARALEQLLRVTALERWPLVGLQSDEVCEFVRERLRTEPDPAMVDALERKTRGNPLFLGESLRSLESRGLLSGVRDRLEWEALLPEGIQHLVRGKLQRLSESATQVLGCAAAIGAELDRGLLEQSVAPGVDVAAGLAEAEAAGLLRPHRTAGGRPLRFPHVLLRDALYAELAPAGPCRRALHARIAHALEAGDASSGSSIAERAHHACEAAPLVDPARAISLARSAAESSVRLHEFERAAVWYRRALDVLALLPSEISEAAAALWLGLAAAQTRALGLERARPAFREAARLARGLGRPDLLAEAALGFAQRPVASGGSDPAVIALLEEAAAKLPVEQHALQARVLSRLAGEIRYQDRTRAEALVGASVAAARRLGDPGVLAQALDDCSFLRWSPADPEGWIDLNAEIIQAALASGDLELALLGHKGRVTGALEIGDVMAVDREIDVCETAAQELRTPYARWLCAALRCMRSLLHGNLLEAERHVSEAIPLGERVDSPDVALELQAQLVYLRLEQGRSAEIEEAARAQVSRFPNAPAWRAALGRILLAGGRLLEARHELEHLAREDFADVPLDRGWLPTLCLATEIAHGTGATRRAELLEKLLEPYARLGVVAGSGLLFYGSVEHHLGLLAATRGRFELAVSRLEAAEATHERMGAKLWACRSRLALARTLAGRGRDRSRSAQLLGGVVAAAQDLSWAGLAAEAAALAMRPGARSIHSQR